MVWYDHFSRILNRRTEYNQLFIDEMVQITPYLELDEPPSYDELVKALTKLKRGKAGGRTGILPELLLLGGGELWDRLLLVMEDVWEEKCVVKDWKDALIIPIPKKGDLTLCDYWRGISLLDVVGKVLARIIQDRPQIVVERVLSDSQCGFRKGRGCIDMIFVARQLVEKSREHNDSLYILFVDLRKAYDSVPRSALWAVLKKCGIPPTMLSLIRSFHEGMCAEVRIGGKYTNSFNVNRGLRQGCTLAPTLFNLYFNAMVAKWRSKCPQAGVLVNYKIGRKLVGDRTAKARLQEITVTESQFADDVAVYATSREVLEHMTTEFVKVAADWGLTVNLEKTKFLALGNHLSSNDLAPIKLNEGEVGIVNDFTKIILEAISPAMEKSEMTLL